MRSKARLVHSHRWAMTTIPAVSVLTAALTAATIVSPSAQRSQAPPRKIARQAKPSAPQPALPCGDRFAFEVLLDRQSFSPGEIDAKLGTNASHALAAMQTARALEPKGGADCATWHALGGDRSGPTTITYKIDEADVKGPFTKIIPKDLEKQASLPALSYRSPLERIAER